MVRRVLGVVVVVAVALAGCAGSSKYMVKADAPTSIVKASFRINRPPSLNITAGMRVVWESAAYDITAVLPQERNRYLDIVAERIGGLLIGD